MALEQIAFNWDHFVIQLRRANLLYLLIWEQIITMYSRPCLGGYPNPDFSPPRRPKRGTRRQSRKIISLDPLATLSLPLINLTSQSKSSYRDAGHTNPPVRYEQHHSSKHQKHSDIDSESDIQIARNTCTNEYCT